MDRYYDVNGSLGGRIVRDGCGSSAAAAARNTGRSCIGFAGAPGADDVYFTADDEQGLQSDRENN